MNELKQLQRQINSNVNKIKLFSSTPYLVSKNKDQLYVLQTNVNNDLKKFKKDTKKYLESIFKTKDEDIQIPKSKKIKCMVKGTYFKDIKDLKLHDKLQWTIRNVTAFGAFVDIGLHNDGLIHISKISKNYIKHPSDVLSVGDIVDVYVIDIDLEKEKVSLSLFLE